MKQNFKDSLRQKMVDLLESKRGVQAVLAKAIDEQASYFSHIKRGHPVNALHLKAVGIVFGPQRVLELLDIDNIASNEDSKFKDRGLGKEIINRLIELEKMSPKAFEMVATYIAGAHEAAKATTRNWEEIEKGGKAKKEVGLPQRKEGTHE
jgi:hypothetical protein